MMEDKHSQKDEHAGVLETVQSVKQQQQLILEKLQHEQMSLEYELKLGTKTAMLFNILPHSVLD